MSRSIRCATSPTAPPASRATPSRRRRPRRAPRSRWCPGPVNLPDPRRRQDDPSRDRARHAGGRRPRRCPPTSAVFAAAVADWRVDEADGEQDQEAGRRNAEARRWWKIPTSWRRSRSRNSGRPKLVVGFAAETDHRDRARPREAQAQGLRLDRRQRRVGRHPASWAAIATPCTSSPPTASNPGRRSRRKTWRARSSPGSRQHLRGRRCEPDRAAREAAAARRRSAAARLPERARRRARPRRRRAGRDAGGDRRRRARA